MQSRLSHLRFYRGAVDGNPSPAFDNAISEFKASVGFVKRPYFTGETLKKMDVDPSLFSLHPAPWMNEISRYLGMHEVRDRSALMAWLKSDGKTLGDPSKLPWCGDAVETTMKAVLGHAGWIGNSDTKLRENPYWALYWLGFGASVSVEEALWGSVAVFERNGGGHVGYVAGYDKGRQRLLIRGGNQSDTVSDSWMDINGKSVRLRGLRWPMTAAGIPLLNSISVPVPRLDSKNNRVETNLT